MWLGCAQFAIAVAIGAGAGGAAAVVARGAHDGLLQFSGGIDAQTSVSRATCTTGPADSIAISLVNVGGWSSLYLTASTPAPGKHGETKVSLQGTGHRDNADAIAIWTYGKKAASGPDAPVRITANGSAGTLKVKLALAAVDDASSIPAVNIALQWTAGVCARA